MTTNKMTMNIHKEFDKDIYNNVVRLAILYHKASTKEDKLEIRVLFDTYLDGLYDQKRITDNEVTFLELWLLM